MLGSVALAGCGVLQGLPGDAPGAPPLPPQGPVTPHKLARPLEFRPVESEQSGACPARANTVNDRTAADCLIVGPSALTVRRLKAVSYHQDTIGAWVVEAEFDRADAHAFEKLTARLVGRPAPRNELAIMIGEPPAGELLAAPAVEDKVAGGTVEIAGPGGEAGARALADRLRGR